MKITMLQKLSDNQMSLLHDFEKELIVKEDTIQRKVEESLQLRRRMADQQLANDRKLLSVRTNMNSVILD